MEGNEDRRGEPRVASLHLVSVDSIDEEGAPSSNIAVGRTLNLSHRGMQLELGHSVPPGTEVGLSMVLVNRIVQLQGHVRFCNEVDADTHVMGILFHALPPQAGDAIDAYLALRAHEERPDEGT